VDFRLGVTIAVFPFGVKGVGEVKCPDEIRAGCAAPDCHGMVLVCEFVNGVA